MKLHSFLSIAFLLLLALPGCLFAEPPVETLKLGAIYSLTGYGALAGRSELNGALLALDEINSAGGIGGKKVGLAVEDNHSELADTVAAFKKLVTFDNVPLILGPNWDEFPVVIAPLAQEQEVVLLLATSTADYLTKEGTFLFTTFPNHREQVRPLAKYIASQDPKNLSMVVTTNTYFENIAKALQAELTSMGIVIKSVEYMKPSENDFRTYISSQRSAKRDGTIVLLQEGGDLGAFFKQAKELKCNVPLYSHDLSGDESLSHQKIIAEGVIFFQYIAQFSPELLKAYKEKYQMEPLYSASRAYMSVHMLAKALEHCGLTSKEMRECLLNVRYKGSYGPVEFSPDGHVRSAEPSTRLMRVQHGEFVPVE